MARLPDVRPGQTWADNDRRMDGRTVRVESVDGRYAYVITLTAAGGRGRVGQKSRISIERMRPTATGYRLVDPS